RLHFDILHSRSFEHFGCLLAGIFAQVALVVTPGDVHAEHRDTEDVANLRVELNIIFKTRECLAVAEKTEGFDRLFRGLLIGFTKSGRGRIESDSAAALHAIAA